MVADLAPLRREDVVQLVESTGTPSGEFMRLVVENKAGMLAGVPLTLKVLLAAYMRSPAELAGGPVRLFELGVAALVDEPDPDRAAPVETVAEQRVAIASRIAAYMLLCGRRTLWMGGLAGKSPRDISPEAVCWPLESSGGTTFPVTPAAVMETTRTALFTWSSENRVAFAHSSFAAHLAASYLASRYRSAAIRGKEREAQRQLAGVMVVTAPEEQTASIPGYLQETAAWLLAHAPAETSWLARADPEGLAAYSAYITSAEVRKTLVDGLFLRSVSIELTDRGWQRARWLLHHPGLGDQIRAVLEDLDGTAPSLEQLSRVRLAVRLAHDSKLVEVVSSLVKVVESSSWPIDLRWSAAYAAVDAAPEVAAPGLRRLLATDVPRELAIELLDLLWPDHLSFSEAAPHFHPFAKKGAARLTEWRVRQFTSGAAQNDLSALLDHIDNLLTAAGIDINGPVDGDLDEADDTPPSQEGSAQSIGPRVLRDFRPRLRLCGARWQTPSSGTWSSGSRISTRMSRTPLCPGGPDTACSASNPIL
jgi:hypothetical protein